MAALTGFGANAAHLDFDGAGGQYSLGVENSAGGSWVTGSSPYALFLSPSGTYPLQVSYNNGNAEAMTVLGTNGNIGFGTTSPLYPLHVVRSSGSTMAAFAGFGANAAHLDFDSAGGQFSLGVESSAGSSWVTGSSPYAMFLSPAGTYPLQISYSNGDAVAMTVLGTNGNVGIGTTSPAGILDVRGGTAASGNGVGIALYAQNGQASGDTNGGNIILMPGAANGAGTPGRVGIGTNSPAHALDVAGDVNFAGTLYESGLPCVTPAAPPAYPSSTVSNEWFQTYTGYNHGHALIYALGYLWLGLNGQALRIDPETGAATACTGVQSKPVVDLIEVGGKILLLYTDAHIVVDEIDPSVSLAATNKINDSAHTTNAGQCSFCSDGSHIYVCTNGTDAEVSRVVKYSVTYSYESQANIASGNSMAFAHCIRFDGTNLWVSCALSSSLITQFGYASAITDYVCLAKMTTALAIAAVALFPSDTDSGFTDDMAITNGHVYCGSETSGNLVRFLKSTLAQAPVPTASSGKSCYCVYNDGKYIWAGLTGLAILQRVEPFSLTVTTFSLGDGQEGPNEIWADPARRNLYLSYWQPEGGSGGGSDARMSKHALAPLQTP